MFVKKLLLCLCGLVAACTAQNLLLNPELAGSETGIRYWRPKVMEESSFRFLPGQGPDGRDAVAIDMASTVYLKQTDLKLVAGEKYRMGGWVRTKNFVGRTGCFCFVLYDFGWNHDVRLDRFPENTDGKWVLMEKEITAPASRNGLYTFNVYCEQGAGSFELCAPFIVPVSPRAKAESRQAELWQSKLARVVPYYPQLNRVDARTGEIRFYTVYPLPGAFSDYRCHVTYTGGEVDLACFAEAPLDARGFCTIRLGKLPDGPGALRVELRNAGDDKAVLSNEYSMTAITPLPQNGRRLNNFVTELVNCPLENKGYAFTAYEEGWYRIAFSQPRPEAKAFLDGKAEPVVEHRDGEASETMRLLSAGQHELRITGAQPGATLVIAKVPQIPFYPYEIRPASYDSPEVRAREPFTCRFYYDLAFYRRHLWHVSNTMVMGNAWKPSTKDDFAADLEFKRRGIQTLGSMGFRGDDWKDADIMVKRILASAAPATTGGVCLDESGPDDAMANLLAISELGWKLQDYDKHVHTWLALHDNSYFGFPDIHRALYASVSNASRGNGKAMLEVYASSVRDEKVLADYLKIFPRQMRTAAACTPDAASRSIIMMGGYVMAGVWNCNPYPQTDIKVFLDEFFHLYATHPDLAGLHGFGCYATVYFDEENIRWLVKLFRHYLIEGRTDKLSPAFGFSYNPGHVQNCDFESGLEHWTAEPAEKDSIQPRNIPGLGARIQCRRSYKDERNGDTCVQLTRSAKAPNRLSQTLRNLVPGKLYSLAYTTEDADDIQKAFDARQDIVFNATLSNCDILPEKGYQFRLPRGWNGSWGQKPGKAEVHTQKIVFRPKADTVLLTFSDWADDKTPGAAIGKKRILNNIAVRPYFDAVP